MKFCRSLGIILLVSASLAQSGLFDTKHEITGIPTLRVLDCTPEELSVLIKGFGNNTTKNLMALMYASAGIYVLATNKTETEENKERYAEGSFACQLAIGTALTALGYYTLNKSI